MWLKAKYETIERLNDLLGLRQWGQVVIDWEQVPMPQLATETPDVLHGPIDRVGVGGGEQLDDGSPRRSRRGVLQLGDGVTAPV